MKTLKTTLIGSTIALLLTGCYAQAGYDVPGPVAYAGPGPVYYDAYPCEWGTCYYDGPRMVYHEQAPARSYYGGVNVRYSATAYRESRPQANSAVVVRDAPSPRVESRQERRPEAAQPAQRQQPRGAQQGAARRTQRQPEQRKSEEHDHK